MTAGTWLAIGGLTVLVVTVVWRRMVEGKPNRWLILMLICLGSGVWHLAMDPVFSWRWLLGGMVGFTFALAGLLLYADKRNHRRAAR